MRSGAGQAGAFTGGRYNAPAACDDSPLGRAVNCDERSREEANKRKGQPKPPLSHKKDPLRSRRQRRFHQHRKPRPHFVRRQAALRDVLYAGNRGSFVAGLVASKEENAASSSVSSSRNRRSSAAPSSAFARS